MLVISIVITVFLCLILPFDHLHPFISPGNNWTQMWSLLVPQFWYGFETLCRFLFLQTCHSVIFSVDSRPGGLWCEVRLLAKERERERERETGVFSSCLRSPLTVSPSHLSMLTAIWSYYLSCRDRFMCDGLYAHWGFLCEECSLCNLKTDTVQCGQEALNIKLLIGCRCCCGGEKNRKTWNHLCHHEGKKGRRDENDKDPQPDTSGECCVLWLAS